MMWVLRFVIICCWLDFVVTVLSFPGIGTGDVCQQASQYTHETAATGPSTYQISTDRSQYLPGQPLKVTISGRRKVHGVILQAKKVTADSVVGSFYPPSPDGALHSCSGNNDTVTLWLTSPAPNVSVEWTAPQTKVGFIHFTATIFQDKKTYWTNVQSRKLHKGFEHIDLSTCGIKKGCYRYIQERASSCTADSCDYLVTYHINGGTATFELSAKADWVAIGFSSDEKMGGDDIFLCSKSSQSGGEVHHYWTNVPYVAPTQEGSDPLTDREIIYRDRRISCRFKRPLKVMYDKFNVDLNNEWYQLYAWGGVSSLTNSLTKHYKDSPPTSDKAIVLYHQRNVFVSTASVQFKLTTSWLIPVTILISLHTSIRDIEPSIS